MQNKTGVDALSNRQKEILRLMAAPHRAKEIADLLNIKEATVRTHVEEARRRLGGVSSVEAVRILLRHEGAVALPKNSGPQISPIPDDGFDVQTLSHDQAHRHEQLRNDHRLSHAGDRFENGGSAGEADNGGGDRGRDSEALQERRNGESALHPHPGVELFDGRWAWIRGRLINLSTFQSILLVILLALFMAFAMVTILAMLGTMRDSVLNLTGQAV